MDFSEAFIAARNGHSIARVAFRDTCYIRVEYPRIHDLEDQNINTMPYLQMVKGDNVFPVDLSCDSLFANDWYLVDSSQPAHA